MRVFKNVVAQFIGRLCLINQATTRILGVKIIKTGRAKLNSLKLRKEGDDV